MKDKILEKLDAEYESFFQDMMRTSKENLFAKSDEIEMKKSIQKVLRQEIQSDERFADPQIGKQLLYTNNLMETCYRYASDHKEMDVKEASLKILFSVPTSHPKE